MNYYKLENIPAQITLHEALSDRLREQSAHLAMPCGGMGRCGKCLVKASGALLSPNENELRLLSEEDTSNGMRLSCLAVCAGGDIEVWIEEGNTSSEIQLDGVFGMFELSPVVCVPKEGAYGLAVDIGTTTVAVYLCDLAAGGIIKTGAFQNPQRMYGADVITRIGYVIGEPERLSLMRELIISGINEKITSFGVDSDMISAAAITGNTTMLHMFCALDPTGIANAPFIPASLFGNKIPASETGLATAPYAPVYLMPCAAAYVGGDITSGMIAAGFDTAEGINLYVDIGTNGEMALGGRDGITLCATAAGPAFEGAHIECGMSGTEGAVCDVYFGKNGLETNVIGGGTPRGICGSALIDAVAIMLERGALGETGRLEGDEIEDGKWYIDKENGIYISGQDIREVQLAKAAVCAGVMTMLEDTGAKLEDISRVFIAGGFGAHINSDNACAIGLLPPSLADRIEIVGNTAGMGAVMYLLAQDARNRIAAVNEISRYIELSGNEFFMDEYVEQMMFGEE